MTDIDTPQSIYVAPAPAHMERPVEVSVTTHLNPSHDATTRVYLTRAEARVLAARIISHLNEETPVTIDHAAIREQAEDMTYWGGDEQDLARAALDLLDEVAAMPVWRGALHGMRTPNALPHARRPGRR